MTRAYTVRDLKQALNNLEDDLRLVIKCDCYMDFGVELRESKELFCTLEIGGDKTDWEAD